MPHARQASTSPSTPGEPALRLATVTYAARPEGEGDDQHLLSAFQRAGAHAEPRVWNDPTVHWAAYDAVVLRSTWDYFIHPEAFIAWLDARDAEGTLVLNPTRVVRWNLDKRYLRELGDAGIAVVPTHWVEPGAPADLAGVMDRRGWSDVVVKPAISGGAHETWRTARARADADEPRARALAARGAVMVQPYLPAIEQGEWSLLFFAGEFSHAALKRPREGDFRVQQQYGGQYLAAQAPEGAVEGAARVVRAARELLALGEALPYARVDGCMVDGRFLLMELEVIEPALFFAQDPAAADRCAAALLGAIAMERAGR